MAAITPARRDVTEEEVSFGAGVSESTWFAIGGAANFINQRQHLLYAFNVNGPYENGAGTTGIDGGFGCLFDIEITGMMVYSNVNGSSGTTTFDLHRYTAGGTDAGTIFSVKPSITTTAGNFAYAITDLITPTTYTDTGVTLPTFSTTDLDAGDMLRFDLDAVMAGAENAGIVMYYRPR